MKKKIIIVLVIFVISLFLGSYFFGKKQIISKKQKIKGISYKECKSQGGIIEHPLIDVLDSEYGHENYKVIDSIRQCPGSKCMEELCIKLIK